MRDKAIVEMFDKKNFFDKAVDTYSSITKYVSDQFKTQENLRW